MLPPRHSAPDFCPGGIGAPGGDKHVVRLPRYILVRATGPYSSLPVKHQVLLDPTPSESPNTTHAPHSSIGLLAMARWFQGYTSSVDLRYVSVTWACGVSEAPCICTSMHLNLNLTLPWLNLNLNTAAVRIKPKPRVPFKRALFRSVQTPELLGG